MCVFIYTRFSYHKQVSTISSLQHTFIWEQTKTLVVSEELNSHPAPEVEEDEDGNGDWQQQAIEAQAAAASTALGEVIMHRSGK